MNISKMSKEEALAKIEELKEYVEKCDLEKEIPEIPHHGNYNVHMIVPDKPNNPYISWDRSFENRESNDLYSILAFELANLVYAREHLNVKAIPADEDTEDVSRLMFSVHEGIYKVRYYCCIDPCEDEIPWFFTKRDDAEKVRDYMNKYVAHIKRNMF